MLYAVALGAVSALLTTAAYAQVVALDDAARLYARGDYAQAADIARGLGDARADALAARALLAEARKAPRDERSALVEAALAAARSAINRDEAQIEGHLQLAVALGFKGRAMGNLAAHQQGLGSIARTTIDAALALEPDNAWARALLGTWHLEILNGAGPLLAAALYGADRAVGVAELRSAVATANANVIVLHQCALQLLTHDAKAFAPEAERWLVIAARAPQPDAFERFTMRQADKLLRALRTGNASLLRREIERQQTSY